MSKGGGMGGFAMAMVFAVTFGAVGVFASWVIGGTLSEGYAARSWTKVDAEVVRNLGDGLQYRYRVDDRDYTGGRIQLGVLENEEIPAEVASRINQAESGKGPLAIYVDPENPARSVVHPAIPWTLVLFMTPFALGFGGVGLGALYVAVRQLIPAAPEEAKTTISSDAGSGFLGLLAFTFMWNVIAIPIAALFVPEMIRTGEWLGLLVLIFPLVGLLMIWGTINSGLKWLRQGGAVVHPQHLPPRLGSPFSGYVAFPRGVAGGDAFRARLACVTGVANQGPVTHWSKDLASLRVADVGGNRRLSFRFDVPDRLPDFDRDAVTDWRLELFRDGDSAASYGFNFKMLPPVGVEHLPEEELRADADVDEEDMPVPAGIPKGLEGIAALVGKERIKDHLEDMPASRRARLHKQLEQLSPEHKATLEKIGKYAHHMPTVKKLVFWAIGLFVLLQVIGVVTTIMFSS